jgi:hypothetical protein
LNKRRFSGWLYLAAYLKKPFYLSRLLDLYNIANGVKAFNNTGAENMADSNYINGLPFMPVGGGDSAIASTVSLS